MKKIMIVLLLAIFASQTSGFAQNVRMKQQRTLIKQLRLSAKIGVITSSQLTATRDCILDEVSSRSSNSSENPWDLLCKQVTKKESQRPLAALLEFEGEDYDTAPIEISANSCTFGYHDGQVYVSRGLDSLTLRKDHIRLFTKELQGQDHWLSTTVNFEEKYLIDWDGTKVSMLQKGYTKKLKQFLREIRKL